MNLRKNKHYNGFYKDLNNGIIPKLIVFTKNRVPKSFNPALNQNLKPSSTEFKKFVYKINIILEC